MKAEIRRQKAEGENMKIGSFHSSSFIPHPSCFTFGFTLLEIMIALAIIGITVTVVLHTVNYHAGVMHENAQTTIMYQAAKEKMYELEKDRKNSRGSIKAAGLAYENIVLKSNNLDIINLKTIVRGHNREVFLNGCVLKKTKN